MKCFLTALLFFVFSSPIFAQGNEKKNEKLEVTSTYTKIGYSDWREVGNNGQPIMSERGPIYTVGAEGVLSARFDHYITWSAEAFGSVVKYNGSDILTGRPKKCLQAYAGVNVETIFHIEPSVIGNTSVNPFVSLGHKAFFKTNEPELWNTTYSRFGLEATYPVGNVTVFVNGGIIAPLITLNHSFYLNIGYEDKDHLVKDHLSRFAEVGLAFSDGRKISLVYKEWKFGPSDPVSTNKLFSSESRSFYQPGSSSYDLQLKFSYRFKKKH